MGGASRGYAGRVSDIVEGAAVVVAGYGRDDEASAPLGQLGEVLLATGAPWWIRRLSEDAGERFTPTRTNLKHVLHELARQPGPAPSTPDACPGGGGARAGRALAPGRRGHDEEGRGWGGARHRSPPQGLSRGRHAAAGLASRAPGCDARRARAGRALGGGRRR